MKSLRCDISDGFYVSVRYPAENENKKRNTNFQLDLFGNSNDSKPVASKSIPWPSNEEAPTALFYSKDDGLLRVKNAVTMAEVPLRLQNLTATQEDTNCKRYKSFASHISEAGSNPVTSAVAEYVKSPTSKTVWKELKNILSSQERVDALSAREQEQLLKAVAEAKDCKFFADICAALSQTDLFAYKKYQEFSAVCLDNGLIDLIIEGLETKLYSEEIKIQILDHISSLKSKEAIPLLEKFLLSGFSTENMVAAAKNSLSPTSAIFLINRLTDIFGDFDKNILQSQALDLISALIDGTGVRLCLELESHPALGDLMETITAFAALSDSFNQFQVSQNGWNGAGDELLAVYRVRRVRTVSRKISW